MRVLIPFLILSVVFVNGSPSRKRRFDGNQVLRILPKTLDELKKLKLLGQKHKADVWKMPLSLNQTMDLHIDAHKVNEFVSELELLGSTYNKWIHDLQKLVDDEMTPTSHVKTRATASFNMAHYHSFAQISSYLDAVAKTSRYATIYTAGQSVEGRDMKYLKISTGGNGSKKAIFIDGGIHAREWIASAVVLYLVDQFAFNPDQNPDVTTLLQKFDWYFLPLMNPDGYEYTRTNNRMWRKNRASTTSIHGTCTGVDLNRNFGFQWNPAVGGSTNQCDETFCGTAPFSEPETKAMKSVLDSITSHTLAYFNLHSYGQMWLWPWGYTRSSIPTDVADLRHMANKGAAGIYASHHHRFTTGGDATDLYPAAGGADDYAKGGAGIKYSYTVELRDTGYFGFVLPSKYIIPSGEEFLKGIIYFAKELATYEHL